MFNIRRYLDTSKYFEVPYFRLRPSPPLCGRRLLLKQARCEKSCVHKISPRLVGSVRQMSNRLAVGLIVWAGVMCLFDHFVMLTGGVVQRGERLPYSCKSPRTPAIDLVVLGTGSVELGSAGASRGSTSK